jgi:hypothetical protein
VLDVNAAMLQTEDDVMRGTAEDRDVGAARGTKLKEPNFYALPFACQMIVWAIRKRLDVLRGRQIDRDEVLKVFHLANWSAFYGALLDAVDVLVHYRRDQDLVLHAQHCPCLAPYEAYLINALAHLQNGEGEAALLSLCEIVTPTGARLTVTELRVIASGLQEQNLECAYIDLSAVRHRAMLSNLSPKGQRCH